MRTPIIFVTPEPETPAAIAEAAARWVARHDRGLTPEERAEFAAWREADPRHAQEWASLFETAQLLGEAGAVSELAAEAAMLDEQTRKARRASHLLRWGYRVGLTAAAIAVGVFTWQLLANRSRSATPPAVTLVAAEAKRLSLPDGSVVEARGDSQVTFDFSGPSRRVRLPKGEAFFSVAHDSSRPFFVETAGVTVRAVGTEFNVRCDSNQVDIIVTEGRVRVSSSPSVAVDAAPLIDAGTAARVAPGSGDLTPAVETRAVTHAEVEGALAWRSPLLEFSRAPLDQVLAAFQQHSPHRVRLGDPALARRQISGTFQAENIEGFLRLAEATFGLRVERRSDGEIILRSAP
ncbi:hypothetical protein DB347_00095 [Opitutaceae bacterium EW11]|nr:hypothetical protein DB347_00095 [Opitutaceae bacterium EW11]